MLIRGLGPSPEKVTLSNAVDRLRADGVRTPEDLIERVSRAGAPALDLYETEGELVVKAHLPGVAPEELHLDVQGRVLTISGETRADAPPADGGQGRSEQIYGAFVRTVPLPCAVKADQAVAELADGLLTLTLPKAEATDGKHIDVKHEAAIGS